jgi:hypothetical protein
VTDRVDLRSDTLTRPVPGMRRAMAEAEVGDDVYDEDPTVRALQDEVAGLFGHEAALFVPSGSMGNQICLGLHAGPGTEVVCDHEAHVVTYELGAAAALFGSTTRTATAEQAHPGWVPQWLAMVRHEGYGTVPTRCVAVEQTHNRRGGLVLDLAELDALRAGIDAVDADVALHCDGARIWNAHVATGVPLARYGALFDTLSVCLSKGLGAPIGSVIVGPADTIERARVLRKRLGGGMRAGTRWSTTSSGSPRTTPGPGSWRRGCSPGRRSPPPTSSCSTSPARGGGRSRSPWPPRCRVSGSPSPARSAAGSSRTWTWTTSGSAGRRTCWPGCWVTAPPDRSRPRRSPPGTPTGRDRREAGHAPGAVRQ